MATFTHNPSIASSVNIKPTLQEASFGDGYEQTAYKGINYRPRVYNLTFNGLTDSNADTIESFFSTNDTAITPFDWTPPDNVAGRFKCKEHNRTYTNGITSNITCTFTEVFY